MHLILDTNCLIYLVKANLQEQFYDLSEKDVVIDNNVFEEAVNKGMEKEVEDAKDIDVFLKEKNIPIIPANISNAINNFIDAGETSCFIISKSGGTVITSDVKAIKKFLSMNVDVVRLEFFFFQKWVEKKIIKDELEDILKRLKNVNAISEVRYQFMLKEMILQESRDKNE